MPIPVSWPTIGGAPFLVPQTGETNWGALTNYLVALANAQSVFSQKVATRVATVTPVTITAATDCAILVNLTIPGPSTVQLPVGNQGQYFIVADAKGDAAVNNITVLPQPGDTINNDPSFTINANDDSITLVFDGINNWKVSSQILSFSPGSVARAAIQAGAPGFVVINHPLTGLLFEEQFLNQLRGGFGADVSLFTGVVKAISGAFSASAIVDADISALAAIDAQKISTGIVNNAEFDRLNEIGLLYSTTKVTGGVGSVNGGNPALLDVSAGTAKQTDYIGTPATPVINNLSFGPFTGVTITNLATADITYVSVNTLGALVQQTTVPTPEERRTNVYLMRINHFNRVNISFVDNIGGVSQSIGNQYGDLVDALGPFNIQGNVVSPNGANLFFNKSAGEMFSRYFNQVTTPLNPHYARTAATAPTSFIYQTRSTTVGGLITAVDPLNYDVGGVVTLVPGGATTSTIQRVYLFPSNNVRIQYGQNLYANLADAVAAVATESFVVNPTNVGFPILIAYIVVQKNCVNLSAATCRILQAARFDVGAGGGSGGTSTIQGAYNNSVAPILVLSAVPGTFRVRDNAVPLGTALLAVADNASSVQYLDVSTQGIKSNQFPTSGRVMITDVNSAASQSAVTSTELGFLSGTTGVTGTNNLVRSTSPVITTPDIDGGTATNAARITIPKNTYANLLALTRKEGTILYASDVDRFFRDDGINLYPVGTPGNISNNMILSAEVANGWTETGSVFATPVTTTAAGDQPLGGVVSSAIQFVATGSAPESGGGEAYNSYPVTTPASFSGKLQISFFMRPGAGFVAGQWTLSVYQGATRQSLSSDSGGVTTLSNITGNVTVSMDAAASTAYTLRFARTSGAGGATLNVTNVFFGYPQITQGAAISEWQTYTPASTLGWGTVTSPVFEYVRIGSSIIIKGKFVAGTTTADEARISLPTGLTSATTNALTMVAPYARDTSAANALQVYIENAVSYLTFGRADGVLAGYTKRLGNQLAGSGETIGFTTAPIPISQWAGNGTVNLGPGAQVEYVYNSSVTTVSDTNPANFAFGPVGALIQNFVPGTTNNVTKRVQFQYPAQQDDIVTLEMNDGNGWVSATQILAAFSTNDAASTYYGNTVVQVAGSATQFDIKFFSAAIPGLAWSGINTWRWRLRKSKASSPVGFGKANSNEFGLVAPRTGQTTMTFSATPAGWSLIRAIGLYYQDQSGNHRMKFTVVATATGAASIAATFSGTVFKNVANYFQPVACVTSSAALPGNASCTPNTGTVTVQTSAGQTAFNVNGDVELESKPTWA